RASAGLSRRIRNLRGWRSAGIRMERKCPHRIEPGFAGRKNADDGEGAAIQLKHLPNNARIGPKAIPPEAVAQHGDVVLLAGLIFVGIEKAAKGGLHAAQREKSRGSAGDGDVSGIT